MLNENKVFWGLLSQNSAPICPWPSLRTGLIGALNIAEIEFAVEITILLNLKCGNV